MIIRKKWDKLPEKVHFQPFSRHFCNQPTIFSSIFYCTQSNFPVFFVLGISLLIPEGAIAPGKTEEIFLAVSSEISENPRLINTRDSILSATVFAGPPTVKFLKPVILSFDQSALRTELDWTCNVYTQAPNADWKVRIAPKSLEEFEKKIKLFFP